ncbi:MAG: SCO family protein [Novosphingobium sp.]
MNLPNAICDITSRRAFIGGAAASLLAPQALAAGPVSGARFPVQLREMAVTDARSKGRYMLLRDLLRDRVGVVSFMFTGCSMICPMQASLLSRTQRQLASEMGKRVVFLSISITPLTDTVEALVRFADTHRAGTGWHFLRGSLADTQRLQAGFDSLAPRVEDHPPMFAIGKASDSRWTRLYGDAKPEKIARVVRQWVSS